MMFRCYLLLSLLIENTVLLVISRSLYIDILYSIVPTLLLVQFIRPVGVLIVPRHYSTEVSLDTYWAPLWCAHTTLSILFFCVQIQVLFDSSCVNSCRGDSR